MNGVSVRKAAKFGFSNFFKHILFFLWTSIVAILVGFLGIFVSTLVAIPFFIPAIKLMEKLKEVVAELKALAPTVQPGLMSPEAKLAMEKLFGLLSRHPYELIFLIIGFIVFSFVLWAVSMMLSIGWIRISLQIKDKGVSDVKALFSRPGMILRATGITILMLLFLGVPWLISFFLFKINVIVAAIALVFSVFLTIYLGLKMAFSFFFLVDKDLGIFESIKASFGLKNGPLNIFLLILLFMVIGSLMGTVVLDVGVFLGSPFVAGILRLFVNFFLWTAALLASAYLYRELLIRR